MADKKISQLTAATTPLAGSEVLPIVQSSTTVKVSVADVTKGRTIQTTGINDNNNNEVISITTTASAVNELTVANAATGANPVISATGGDTNIGITFTPKGTGNAVLTSGNLVVANGNGIDFSAHSSTPGVTSELLADYEEGTWTPSLSSSGATFTYGTSTGGSYVKVGNMVTVHGVLSLTGASGGTAGNALFFDSLPFAPGNPDVGGSGTGIGIWSMSSGITLPANYAMWMAAVRSGVSVLPFYSSTNGGSARTFQYGDITATATFQFSLTYRTA